MHRRDADMKLSQDTELVTDYQSGIGSLQWDAGMPRSDIAADVSLLQGSFEKVTVKDLAEVNRCVRYLRATMAANITTRRLNPESLIIASYSDASWANAPGLRSQVGLLVINGESVSSILEWKSHRLRRVSAHTFSRGRRCRCGEGPLRVRRHGAQRDAFRRLRRR